MKRPFTADQRIASAPTIERLRELLVIFWFGNQKIRIEGETVYNGDKAMSVGIFREKVRGSERIWAYFTN